MRFLLDPVGSSGDVHPFVGLGRELRARGHAVSLLAAEQHRAVVERNGLDFAAKITAEAYDAATRDPELWHPRHGFRTVLRLVVPSLEDTWRALEARYQPGHTVIVGHPLSFAARSFVERYGVPAATIHLAPSSLRTAYQVPVVPPATDISGWPLGLKQAFWWAVDRAAIDPLICPQLNRWRGSHGLPPVTRIFREWINMPGLVIGMFPEWLAPRQPDWPAGFRYASFPLWDDPAAEHATPTLEAFLSDGPPPVVASPGSANRHAAGFFTALAGALRRLGRRGLFLTGYAEQVPAGLPPSVLHQAYAPFSVVLPRASLLVHHGGVGSMAQGFAAGVPQLIMPMSFDQPDNALRAERLGVARWLAPRHFDEARVTRALGELLESAEAAGAAAGLRGRLAGVSGVQLAADLLETIPA